MSPQPTGNHGVGPSFPVNQTRHHRRRHAQLRFVSLAGAAAFAVAVSAGCAAKSDASAPTTTVRAAPAKTTPASSAPATAKPTGSTAPTTTTPSDDEAQVRAVIDRYWQEWLLAGDPPDPSRPALREVMRGDALGREIDNLQKKLALGESRRKPPNSRFVHRTTGVVVNGDKATLNECVVDDIVVLDTADGTVRNNLVATFQLQKILVRSAGTWQIEESSIVDQKDGAQSCDA